MNTLGLRAPGGGAGGFAVGPISAEIDTVLGVNVNTILSVSITEEPLQANINESLSASIDSVTSTTIT